MAQGKTLKEEVSTHRQGDPNRHDRGKGGAQGLSNRHPLSARRKISIAF